MICSIEGERNDHRKRLSSSTATVNPRRVNFLYTQAKLAPRIRVRTTARTSTTCTKDLRDWAINIPTAALNCGKRGGTSTSTAREGVKYCTHHLLSA